MKVKTGGAQPPHARKPRVGTRPIDPWRARLLRRPDTCCIGSFHGAYGLLGVNRTGLYALAKLDPGIIIRMPGERVLVDIGRAIALQIELAAAAKAAAKAEKAKAKEAAAAAKAEKAAAKAAKAELVKKIREAEAAEAAELAEGGGQ